MGVWKDLIKISKKVEVCYLCTVQGTSSKTRRKYWPAGRSNCRYFIYQCMYWHFLFL